MDVRVRLAPGVPDLAALGAREPEELLLGGLEEEHRAQEVAAGPGWREWRLPLPGTPDGDGPLTGSPRGAGTGWVRVVRHDGGPWARRLGARFRHPRSGSLAERDWNLLCALRAGGVVTAEPLAVAAAGDGLVSRRSALVTREVEVERALPQALAALPPGRERRALVRAVGQLLRRLAQVGVARAELGSADVGVLGGDGTHADSPADACGLEQVLAARPRRGAGRPAPAAHLAWREAAELVLLRTGDLALGTDPRASLVELLNVAAHDHLARALSARERRAVLAGATSGLGRAERARLLDGVRAPA